MIIQRSINKTGRNRYSGLLWLWLGNNRTECLLRKCIDYIEKGPLLVIRAYIPIHIAVITHCQTNENPCSSQENHVLFEHEFELKNT